MSETKPYRGVRVGLESSLEPHPSIRAPLRSALLLPGDRLTIVTNGGGPGVMATDALILAGGRLAMLSEETMKRLDSFLPPNWSLGNPVDIIGDAPAERYVETIKTLLAEPGTEAVLFIHAPSAIVPSEEIATALVPVAKEAREMAFIATNMDEQGRMETLGVVRSITDSNNHQAEMAILVRSDLKGKGLDRTMLEKMIRYCRSRGTEILTGEVLRSNTSMLGLAKKLDFDLQAQEDRQTTAIRLNL